MKNAEKALVKGMDNNDLMWWARHGLKAAVEKYRGMVETGNDPDGLFHIAMTKNFEKRIELIDKALEARA